MHDQSRQSDADAGFKNKFELVGGKFFCELFAVYSMQNLICLKKLPIFLIIVFFDV